MFTVQTEWDCPENFPDLNVENRFEKLNGKKEFR